MADLKFTDLTAGSTGINNSSLVCFSEYDGVSAYTSKKYTISTMRDILNVWEAEDKITFVDGTNLFFVQNSAGNNAGISMDSSIDYVGLEADGTSQGFSKGFCWVDDSTWSAGYNSGVNSEIICDALALEFQWAGVTRFKSNATGISFFNATPVAKQTSVPVSAAGIHAALVNYGLIT
jgi:hypothetical protein